LLPMLVGLFLWKELPDTLPSHFGFDGTVDGYSSKVEAVFMIPALMMGVHILAVVLTSLDPKARNVTPKVGTFIYWIIPL
ncbi:DUF1648 domain-containing protein, partial [Streptococcus pyogenes]